MDRQAVNHAITLMGVEIVEFLRNAVGGGRWASAVLPFARVRPRDSDVLLLLPAVVDPGGADLSGLVDDSLRRRPQFRERLLHVARVLGMTLDRAQVDWDWGAVRVRHLPGGATRAGLEIGSGTPPVDTAALLGTPTIAPPPDPAREPLGTPPPPMPSYIPPAALDPARAPMATPVTALEHGDLRKTMARAEAKLASTQEEINRETAGARRATFLWRDRAVEFDLVRGGTLRLGCEPIATYVQASRCWRWGWGNDAWPPTAREHAQKIRQTGVNWGLDALILPEVFVNGEDAFRLATLGAWVMGARGVHFLPGDGRTETVLALYGTR